MVIDAHQHFWQLDGGLDYRWLDAPNLAPIRRDFLPNDLEPLLQEVGVERTILVQTQHDPMENDWAIRLAEEHEFIAGVVGWVDLADPVCERRLIELKQHRKFVGVRHITQDERDDDFIVREPVLKGLRILEKHTVPFDLLFYVKHLRHVPTLARELPKLSMVIDHLSKPEIRRRKMDPWANHLRAAAQFPNVYCKLSGMVTEADWSSWSVDDLRPYVQDALHAFGPSRCMFGSDWPVCQLAATYGQVYEVLVEALGPISETERRQVFALTAASFYRLPIS
jgi:L-fuconolactonase